MPRLKGVVRYMHEAEKTAEIKANGKIYTFSYDVVEDNDYEALFEGLEVSFETNKENEVLSVIPNYKQERPDYLAYLEVTKDVHDCLFNYFSAFSSLLQNYQDISPESPEEDFLKMRRFLLTAYNDIHDIDFNVIDKPLAALKSELDKIFRYYTEFKTKSGYSVQYAYEKIFLMQQPQYVALIEKIAYIKGRINQAAVQEKSLALQIKERERELEKWDSKTKSFAVFEKNLKAMRKRYADLVYFLGKQRDLVAKLVRVRVIFVERFFAIFRESYEPTVKEFEQHLLRVLNVKSAELDKTLWTKAKQSRLVRNFFIKSGIVGTYSSKTFLKYYLRNIDQEKAGDEAQKLFALLNYMESISTKNIVLVRSSLDVATSNKELLEKFDKALQIRIMRDPQEIFNPPKMSKQGVFDRIDLMIIEFEALGLNCYPFIERYRREKSSQVHPTIFCLLTREISPNLMAQGKKLGIDHFLNSHCTDEEFIDAMREIL
ncbi:hypothetical protein CCZ01_08805 [Helicobacter monodelphidis]|uniref:hypothetical protein n=1 Tax=Helicobacter sp. 15-1451 TaxID=2004995 RepID=UPI000DCEDAE8|nr:hypothetical protein [Helicobacter sp. 15-1451]RAX56672.1 hypothetical protein CCZ01_08805 [Helicobacter sp. 15-1451]